MSCSLMTSAHYFIYIIHTVDTVDTFDYLHIQYALLKCNDFTASTFATLKNRLELDYDCKGKICILTAWKYVC